MKLSFSHSKQPLAYTENNIYIGINTSFLTQSFTLKHVPLTINSQFSNSKKQHLLINKHDTLIKFQQKTSQVKKKCHLKYDLQLPSMLSQVAYLEKYKLFFVLLQSGKTVVLDHNLKIIKTLDLVQLKHSLELFYINYCNNQIQTFLMIKPDSTYMMNIKLFTNHDRIKSKSALTFNLQLGKMNKLKTKLEFTQGFKFFKKQISLQSTKNKQQILKRSPKFVQQKLTLILHSSTSVQIYYFYQNQSSIQKNLYKDIQPYFLQNIIQELDSITCLAYMIQQNVLIIGTDHGDLLGFQILKTSNANEKQKQDDMISLHSHSTNKKNQYKNHNNSYNSSLSSKIFRKIMKVSNAHSRTVLSIELNKNNKIITHGADDNIHLIDLDSMSINQTFKLPFHSLRSLFLNQKVLMTLAQTNQIFLNKIKIDHKMVYNHNCSLAQNISISEDKMSLVGFSDNSLVSFGIKNTKKRSNQNKNKKQYIINQTFIPPKCKQVLCFVQNPYKRKNYYKDLQTGKENKFYRQYWLLTQKSEIYKYYLQDSLHQKMKIKQVAKVIHFFDKFEHEFYYQPNVMDFLTCMPINFDSDVLEPLYEPNTKKANQVQPVIFGCIEGYIIAVSSKNLEDIIFKICPFNVAIQTMFQLSVDHQKSFIISMSRKQFIFTQISPTDQPIISHRIMLKWQSWVKKLRRDCAALIDGNTIRLIFSMNNFLLAQDQQNVGKTDHQIKYVNITEYFNQILTGDKGGNIIFWNFDLQIQRKVILTESFEIQYASLVQDTLFFGYQKKIYQIDLIEYQQQTLGQDYKLKPSIVLPHLDNLIEARKSLQNVLRKDINFDKTGKIKFRFAKKTINEENSNKTIVINSSNQKKKDFSLPKINQSNKNQHQTIQQHSSSNMINLRNSSQLFSSSLNKSHLQIIDLKNSPKNKRKVDLFERQKRKRDRNKSASFIFHFPNNNVYRQLIKKKFVDG